MRDILQDLRYAIRTFRKSAGLTAIVVVSLALGIGATTAMFTVLYAVIVRPLPFPVSLLNQLVIGLISRSPYVREAKQNYDDWRARRREGAR